MVGYLRAGKVAIQHAEMTQWVRSGAPIGLATELFDVDLYQRAGGVGDEQQIVPVPVQGVGSNRTYRGRCACARNARVIVAVIHHAGLA